MRVRLVIFALLISLIAQPALALDFNSVEVSYCNGSIRVEVFYTLDAISAIKVFLFGAGCIEDDVRELFVTDDYVVEKIDFNHAEFFFPVEKSDECLRFDGVKLSKPLNVTLKIGSEVDLGTTDEIPQLYFCID